jgi:D-sedoheptulose 7-phosphate isomerase
MKELFKRYPMLKPLEKDISTALEIMLNCYYSGGKIMLIGNGGSASDCAHMTGELLKDFYIKRPIGEDFYYKLSSISESARQTANKLQQGIACIDLTAFNSTLTAIGNDTGFEFAFAQTLYSLYKPNDILIAFTTSGTSKNIIKTLEVAKALGSKTITFTGENGLKDESLSTVTLKVPEHETFKAQELHLPIYHYLCKRLEEILFEV